MPIAITVIGGLNNRKSEFVKVAYLSKFYAILHLKENDR
ncbi:Hypothetical protein F387_01431 [Wohlfahrtiimonas chitiniclastica SH04]|uniref:Uncharacterized protein n=1 Tax=Wohlfahrtiimonas chitiniclastica SH04 TaxID=1261130 RepID=L8XUP4_9GAMM|nr:Hypothetical protein F387_01431 [Wohlfahrtiimonas chitiniclastica SH04]